MYRAVIKELQQWKRKKNRKPLIIQGARQVGKTWILQEFGKSDFQNVAYINFESSARLRNIFEVDFDTARIIESIAIECNQMITPSKTLIILDEIQATDQGITSLKYFCENAPEYHIVAAGSLLGVAINQYTSFPVGKVDFLNIYPLSFREFLWNLNEKKLCAHLEQKNWNIIQPFHDKLTKYIRLYYYLGGMPEVLARYIDNKDLEEAREIQKNILKGYENDFAKYAPNTILPRMRMVWDAILPQLSKENKKFIFGQIKSGGRAAEFDLAIRWLIDAGLIIKVCRVQQVKLPLRGHAELDTFKLYMHDIGLMNAMAELDPKILFEKNNILTEYKGALTEQFVCQQLHIDTELCYWTAENGTAEVDFIIQKKNETIPIEVKAEENLKAKSLKLFVDRYKNNNAIRISMSEYRVGEWVTNVPLYGVNGVLG